MKIIGRRFGKLIVLYECNYRKPPSKKVFRCLCDCGKEKDVVRDNLMSGYTMTCGCATKELISKSQITHGLSKHPLYKVWCGMIDRCTKPNRANYVFYGAKGVKVCDIWMNDFVSFYEWGIKNGYKNGLKLDKDIIGDGKLYSPETCCFVTTAENNRYTSYNFKISYDGRIMVITDWASELGMSIAAIKKRISKWGLEKAMTTPITSGKVFFKNIH